MKRITTAGPPTSVQTLVIQGASFEDLKQLETFRETLRDEQFGRCAYCERRVVGSGRIEHFHPQSPQTSWSGSCRQRTSASQHAETPTRWRNLLLCCDGNERNQRGRTCDVAKASQHICERFENPKTATREWLAVSGTDGHLVSEVPLDSSQDVVDTVLNLNEPSLVAAREREYAALARQIVQRRNRVAGLTTAERRDIATKLRAETLEPGREFVSVLEALARRFEP